MDANGFTQKKKVTMAEFFDYPEYAYNEKGQLKNWVAGPNPWVPAATVGLLSLLGGIEEAEGGGYGLNLDSIVDAGLLGTKTYLEGTQNLQNQRKDYYDHNLRSQQQMRENLKFQHETEDRELLKERRRSMVEGLPNLFKELEKTNIPDIKSRIPVLKAMAESGKIESAYQTTANLASQIGKVTKDKPEMITLPDGKTILVQKDSEGSFSVVPGQSLTSGVGLGGTRGKLMNLIYKASKGIDGLTLDHPLVMSAYEELGKPIYKDVYNPQTGETKTIPVPGYVPKSIKKIMEGEIDSSTTQTEPPPEPVLKKVAAIPQGERASAGYANRMQKAMYTMDELMAKGYRPSRTTLQFVIMGAPQTYAGRLEKEAYRKAMSPDDRIFARAVQDFLRAKLRKESGAVIGVEEAAEEVEAFFNVPSPGTGRSPDALSDKYREARISALESMIGESGPAWTRWKDLGFNKQPRSSKYFYDNSPFASKTKTKNDVRQQVRKLLKP